MRFKILKIILMGYPNPNEPAKIQTEPEPKLKNIRMGLKSLTPKTRNLNRSEPNPNGYPNAHP